MTNEEELAASFETQRAYLLAIAYRMLGSHTDADDAVQEAWLRLGRTGAAGIEGLRGWLTTVTSRICLDALRRRGVRGEQPLEFDVGTLSPEPVGASRLDPEKEALLGEPAADNHAAGRAVVEAFLAAAGRGDVAALLTLLAPDVELRAQGPAGAIVIPGAGEVARQATTFARPDALAHPALVDGLPGVLVTVGGRPVTVMAFTVTNGAITAIHALTAPTRLGQVVPSWVA